MTTNKKFAFLELIGVLFSIGTAFLLHFLFEWCSSSPFIAWLAPVNESIWEHGKLLFYPYLIYCFFEIIFIRDIDWKSYLTAKCIPLIFCIPIMIATYYTYFGIIGKNIDWLNIVISIVIIIGMYIFSYKSYSLGWYVAGYQVLLTLVIGIMLMLVIFTYYPIHIPLFQDSQTGNYGIS